MYEVGAVVDGFELTATGEWVRRSPTAGSPYRLGDVVDGHLLDADLTWVPLRRDPAPPYVPGDVVDGHVLVPDEGWVPLAGRVRERAAERRRTGGARPAVPDDGAPTAAEVAARRAAVDRARAEREAAQRRADAERSAARARTVRPAPGPAAGPEGRVPTAGASAAGTPAAPRYRVGDVVNGHVLTPDLQWRPVAREGADRADQRSAPRAPQRATGSGLGRLVPVLVVGFVLLQLVRACG